MHAYEQDLDCLQKHLLTSSPNENPSMELILCTQTKYLATWQLVTFPTFFLPVHCSATAVPGCRSGLLLACSSVSESRSTSKSGHYIYLASMSTEKYVPPFRRPASERHIRTSRRHFVATALPCSYACRYHNMNSF